MGQVPAPDDMVTRDTAVTLTISGGLAIIPDLKGQTLEAAEIALLNSNLTLTPSLKYMDAQTPEMHGTVAAQSPEADNRVVENTAVTLTLYADPDRLITIPISVRIPESDSTVKVRIGTQAAGSTVEIDSRTYTLAPEDSRLIEDTLTVPDGREYSYFVYVGDVLQEQKSLTAQESDGSVNTNE